MAPSRSTLIIKFDPDVSCLLSAESPTPIHIFALLTQPLSGTCHTLHTLTAKTPHAGGTKQPNSSAKTSVNDNTGSRVFAADVTIITADATGSAEGAGGKASLASAATMPQQACLKYAVGVEEVAALRWEGLLYSHELAALADVAVPKTYGFFTGGTVAVPVACLVMDLCVSTEKLGSANEFWCVSPPAALSLGVKF
jgi:hypothetical protein